MPQTTEGLSRAVSETHRRYTRHVNFREGWRGHLWQGRFSAFPMDEAYLLAAARYVELNPVKAGMVGAAWEYRWSSAGAHVRGRSEGGVNVSPLLARVADWKSFLESGNDEEQSRMIDRHERTGRPLGNKGFIAQLEVITGLALSKRKTGPRPKAELAN